MAEDKPKGKNKPGAKTSEGWFAFILGVAGAALASGVIPDTHWAAQVAGAIVSLGAFLGYNKGRVDLKKAQILLLCLIPLAAAGCSGGMIRASEIDGPLGRVADRHDLWLEKEKKETEANTELTKEEKKVKALEYRIWLRDTELLRLVLEAAADND